VSRNVDMDGPSSLAAMTPAHAKLWKEDQQRSEWLALEAKREMRERVEKGKCRDCGRRLHRRKLVNRCYRCEKIYREKAYASDPAYKAEVDQEKTEQRVAAAKAVLKKRGIIL